MCKSEEVPRQLQFRSRFGDPGRVRVEVADTGPGVEGAVAQQVFEPFFSTKPNGMGMGLAISRSIVESHGGSIWYLPTRPGGASFASPFRWRHLLPTEAFTHGVAWKVHSFSRHAVSRHDRAHGNVPRGAQAVHR